MKNKTKIILAVVFCLLFIASFITVLAEDSGDGDELDEIDKGIANAEKTLGDIEDTLNDIFRRLELDDGGKLTKTNKDGPLQGGSQACGEIKGAVRVTRETEKDKCLQPTQFVKASDTTGENFCCMGKESLRESVKKPGTLGRLGVCLGLIPSAEQSIANLKTSLGKVKTTLSGMSEFNGNDFDEIIEKADEIDNKENHAEKIDFINEDIHAKIIEQRTKISTKLTELKGDAKANTEKIAKLEEAQEQLGKAQDHANKVTKIHAVTNIECAFNLISLTLGGIKAGILAFQGGNQAMGSCEPEQALVGTGNCLSCNEDPLRVCTESRCNVLGDCIPVPTEKANEFYCIPGECTEKGHPTFDQGIVEWYIDGVKNGSDELQMSGGNIRTILNSGDPIPFNTRHIFINLTTDDPARCYYILDKTNASLEEMQEFTDGYYPTKSDGSGGWQYAQVLLPGDISRNAGHKIYIKCINPCGIEPKSSYDANAIAFKLDKKPDQLPPEIIHIDPDVGSVVRGDLEYINVSFWLDERGTCRFSDASNNQTTTYAEMQPFGIYNHENSSIEDGDCYQVDCQDRKEKCSVCWLKMNPEKGYTNVSINSTEFNETSLFNLNILCADIKDNIMPEENVLNYYIMTAPGYEINVTSPDQNEETYDREPLFRVESGTRTTECRYNLEKLSTGRNNPVCSLRYPDWDDMWEFGTGSGIEHETEHNETLNASRYNLCVKCRDGFKIEAVDDVDFTVLVDTTNPEVIRMYHDTMVGDYLVIETSEESNCVYALSSASYNFTDGNEMTTSDNYLHAAYWQVGSPYYIKCMDTWDNWPGMNDYTIIIHPYEVPEFTR